MFPANEGLVTVRKLLAHYKRIVKDGANPLGRPLSVIENDIAILAKVEFVLSIADESNAYFCIAVSDE
jgi:small ligand-binding sensory domain FIST